MRRNTASSFYRITSITAVISILAGIAWNVWAFDQRRQAEDELRTLFSENSTRQFSESTVGQLPAADDVPRVVSEQYQRIGRTNQRLQLAFTYGGGLILLGIFLYGLGWNARNGSRRR